LGLDDIDFCGPDLTEVVDQAAQHAFNVNNLIRAEPEEPSAWCKFAIEEISAHTIPVAPRIILLRRPGCSAGWSAKKARMLTSDVTTADQPIEAPDVMEEEAPDAMEAAEADLPVEGVQHLEAALPVEPLMLMALELLSGTQTMRTYRQ
jgi:hypothetical protein